MEEAVKIASVPRDANDRPLEDVKIASIRVDCHGVNYPFERY